MDFVLRGGAVVNPASGLEAKADLWVSDGAIAGIGDEREQAGWEVIDVAGLVVCPGLIDVHVHLREPGQEHKETIATGTRAAVAGGFTSVCCMPNTTPPIDRLARIRDLQQRISADARCRVFIIGAATLDNASEDFSDPSGMVAAGCVAITDDALPLQSVDMMAEALQRSVVADVPFVAHCEDESYSGDGVMNEGIVSRDLGLPGQSPVSEQYALRDWSWASASAGIADTARLHVAHVSSHALLRGLEQLRAETPHLQQITLETAPHYFSLTEEAVRQFGADAKMNPPLRTEADRKAIRAALRSGVISVIATDHAPHSPQEKSAGMIEAPFGIVGLETSLGVTLTELVHTGEMDLRSVLALMTCNPAEVFRLKEASHPLGRLAVGAPADITIIDPSRTWVVDPGDFQSKGRNSPFAGRELKGKAWGTIVGGEIMMRDYELLD